MKQLKDLIIIPSDGGPAQIGTGDPDQIPEGVVGFDLDLANQLRESVTVPIDTSDPAILARKADFLRRHGFPVGSSENIPRTDAGREYLDRFSKEPTYRREISEIELKQHILEACEAKAATQDRVFMWDTITAWTVRNMMYYFGNHPACEWPLNKGLLLFGTVGVGKTWMFEIFRDISRKYLKAGRKNFKMTTCRNLYDVYKNEGKEAARAKYGKGNWCFDDLGNEPVEHKDYGNSVLPVEEIMILRDSEFSNGYWFTFISTNLSLEEIRDRYGLRMFDRLMRMCHPVEWAGESKRN